MRIVDIIAHKRAGAELSQAEIDALVHGCASGEVPDYQVAAWLMAAYLRGLSKQETYALTQAIVRSGRVVDWTGRLPFVVDKHSTGGVGDKTTLVVVPLVAAAGVPVAKMSGRGLGITGGTLDKLESIPGFTAHLSIQQLQEQVSHLGLAIVAPSLELAPADGKLYALRDATATVESLPLIASSVMSKKIAGGAHGIVLDVKAGRGAFMRTVPEAESLALTMMDLGRKADRRVRSVISAMDEPLGLAVGNALEVKEAVLALRGEGPSDLVELAMALGAQVLLVAGQAADDEEARRRLRETFASGRALERLLAMVVAQGGDSRALEDLDSLPRAPVVGVVHSPRAGFVAEVDARVVGQAVVDLGGGREKKEDAINHAVGIVLRAKRGVYADAGSHLFEVHAASAEAAEEAARTVLQAYSWDEKPPAYRPLLIKTLA